MNRYKHIIFVTNPKSTKSTSSKAYLEAIQKITPEASHTTITLDGYNQKIPELLRAHSLLCVAGGDGSVNSVVGHLLLDTNLTQEQQKTPVLPLWCGNANDLAHMANGRAAADKCRSIIGQGRTIPVYPLRCQLKNEQENIEHLAISYISFGVSARTAQQINQPTFRQNSSHPMPGMRTVNEVSLLVKAMYQSPTFTIKQGNERKIVFDWIIGKGSRMAKNVRLPIKLTDQAFYQSLIPNKYLPDIASRLAGMAWGTLKPKPETEPIVFTTEQSVWAQFDGEPLHVPADTTITITLSPRPFYLLSTELKI